MRFQPSVLEDHSESNSLDYIKLVLLRVEASKTCANTKMNVARFADVGSANAMGRLAAALNTISG